MSVTTVRVLPASIHLVVVGSICSGKLLLLDGLLVGEVLPCIRHGMRAVVLSSLVWIWLSGHLDLDILRVRWLLPGWWLNRSHSS